MPQFLEGTWEIVVQLSLALGIIASIAISLYVIITKSSLCSSTYTKWQTKRRLKTCPQTAIMATYRDDQEVKVNTLHDQLLDSNHRTLIMHGSHIVLFCMFVQFRGFLPRYERVWLQNSMEEYTDSGGNHGVEEIFTETMKLPEVKKTRKKPSEKE